MSKNILHTILQLQYYLLPFINTFGIVGDGQTQPEKGGKVKMITEENSLSYQGKSTSPGFLPLFHFFDASCLHSD